MPSRRRVLLDLMSPLMAARSVRAALRPNFVVVLLDHHPWDDIHCVAQPSVQPPNSDRIAREAAQFRNAFVTSPLCSPSRACFLTGQYPHTNGIIDNTDRSPLSHKLDTFPRHLQR